MSLMEIFIRLPPKVNESMAVTTNFQVVAIGAAEVTGCHELLGLRELQLA